jgi:hypothetical protein
MATQLAGTAANLVGYWKLNGDLNDSTPNGDHLTTSDPPITYLTDIP